MDFTEPEAPGVDTAMNFSIPPLDVLSLDDILNEHDILVAKEEADKAKLEHIWSQHISTVKPKLVEWVGRGKPNAFPIMMLDIQPPAKCSDGESRTLTEYITFCSGKSIEEHVALLQAKLVGITVSFANISGQLAIVVSQ